MRLSIAAACSLAFFAACSSSSSSSSSTPSALTAVVQDLGADPSGLTTIVSLPSGVGGTLTPGNFQADGGQIATSVTVVGTQATVEWDERVTPSHRVRVVGVASVLTTFADVTTTDASAPTYTVSAGMQNPGLGADTFAVQFSGPQVVESMAENATLWRVLQDGNIYPLTGATIDYNPSTGVATFALGATASLHASYNVSVVGLTSVADVAVSSGSVAGTAAGDSSVPLLTTAEQNLTADEFGRVVDFTFSEAMDPVTSLHLANYVVGLPVLATNVVQVSAGVLRVTFSEPVIPGVDSVLVKNLSDTHGNEFVNVTSAVAQGAAVLNDFAAAPELRTVENEYNDLLVATFDQALDPEDADDDAHWSLTIDGVAYDLSTATLTYDLLTKSLTIELGADYLNGLPFVFGAASGNEPIDVDGDDFIGSYTGAVAGDNKNPRVALVVQNRQVDPSGKTIDVTFNESVDEASAETFPNWSASGGQTLSAAMLLSDLRTLRLTHNAHIIPGETTLSTANVKDLAGNTMLSSIQNPILSTDSVLPIASFNAANAIEGANNDTVVITFDDTMIEAEVEDPTNWSLQSPVGTLIDTSGASVNYDATSGVATLTLIGGGDLASRELAILSLSGMRDLGGNPVGPFPLVQSVEGDIQEPTLVATWIDGVDDTIVHVAFSEPCKGFDDLYDPVLNAAGLTQVEVKDTGGTSLGYPTAVTVSSDGLEVELEFGFSVTVASDTLDLKGVIDMAGNPFFPVLDELIVAQDVSVPALAGGSSSAVALSGEENDSITIVFDQPMNPWGLFDSTNYDFALMGTPITLSDAAISFDGVSTVTMELNAANADDLEAGASYVLSVSGMQSIFGIPVAGPSTDTVVVAGDANGPDSETGGVRLSLLSPTDSILADFDEAVLVADGNDVTAVDISAVNPVGATLVGPRTSALTFGAVSLGETVNFQMRDRAGNLGLSSELIAAVDSAPPVAASVVGITVPGYGGDQVVVAFIGLVDVVSATELSNYALSQNSLNVSLVGATARYTSTTNEVVITLADGVNLIDGLDVTMTVNSVEGHSGLVMGSTPLVGATSGDSVAPTLVQAFVNWRDDFTGQTIEIRLSEDVLASMPSTPTAWTSDGGQFPIATTIVDHDLFRVRFSTPFVGGEVLTLLSATDLAGNIGSSLTVTVID